MTDKTTKGPKTYTLKFQQGGPDSRLYVSSQVPGAFYLQEVEDLLGLDFETPVYGKPRTIFFTCTNSVMAFAGAETGEYFVCETCFDVTAKTGGYVLEELYIIHCYDEIPSIVTACELLSEMASHIRKQLGCDFSDVVFVKCEVSY